MTVTKVVENGVQAKAAIEELETQGYHRDHIYIFAHYAKRSEDIAKELGAETVGMKEEGLMNTIKNLFSSQGDELRTKLQAVGLSAEQADLAEKELDQGRLVIVAHEQ